MSLYSALSVSAEALDNYQRALETAQNNVLNASTPGYARTRQTFAAKEFDPEHGLGGGSLAAGRESSRNEFAERGVWRQNSLLGRFDQLAQSLEQVETVFDATGQTGIPLALNRFFAAVSSLSVTPNDAGVRQTVLDQAGQVVEAFHESAAALRTTASAARPAVPYAVDKINALSAQVRELNLRAHQDIRASQDPGQDAQAYAALENLSEYADVQVLHQADGTFTVLLGGQTPLVNGDLSFPLHADLGSTPGARVLDSSGNDVTAQIHGGRLAGALQAVNTAIPGLEADLNSLAMAFADQVNVQQGMGVDGNGLPGKPIFSYATSTDAASSLQLNGMAPEELAAASAAAPGGNGNALDMAALSSATLVEGFTFAGFYGRLAGSIGGQLSGAQESRDTQQQLLVQARSLRADQQGVSLDEEASRLIELQRAYQAAAKMVSVLDQLTQTAIDMVQ
jgi:flagellar hook-associated protein 1 FlgK